MTLFNKLEETIKLGYSVNFKSFMQHFYITIEKETLDGNLYSNCNSLPLSDHFKEDRFDSMQDWLCSKSKRKIQGAVEWHEENKIEVPSWCEILSNDFTKEELETIKIDSQHILSCIALSKEHKQIRENIINKINYSYNKIYGELDISFNEIKKIKF